MPEKVVEATDGNIMAHRPLYTGRPVQLQLKDQNIIHNMRLPVLETQKILKKELNRRHHNCSS